MIKSTGSLPAPFDLSLCRNETHRKIDMLALADPRANDDKEKDFANGRFAALPALGPCWALPPMIRSTMIRHRIYATAKSSKTSVPVITC